MKSSAQNPLDVGTEIEARRAFATGESSAAPVPRATTMNRMIAYTIDSCCVLLLLTLLFFTPALGAMEHYLLTFANELERATPEQQEQMMLYLSGVTLLLQFVAEAVYFFVLEMLTGGRSVGKAMLGMRVCTDDGRPLTARASLVRNLMRIIDMLPMYYLLGFLSIVVSRDNKRIGDYAAGTIVVKPDR